MGIFKVFFSIVVLQYSASVLSLDISSIDIPANDIVFEPVTNKIYVTVSGTAGPDIGNTITSINPDTKQIEDSIFIGSEPGDMSLAEGTQTIWVLINGASGFRSFDASTQVPGQIFSAGTDSIGRTLSPQKIEAAPFSSNTVAINRVNGFSSGEGIAIFVDGIALPNVTPRLPSGATSFAFSDNGLEIAVLNQSFSRYEIEKYTVTSSGLNFTEETIGTLSGVNTNSNRFDIDVENQIIYSSVGTAFDFSTSSLLGRFSFPSFFSGAPFEVLSQFGVICFIENSSLWIFDLNNYTLIDSILISGINGSVTNLIAINDADLAFTTDAGQLFFIENIDEFSENVALPFTSEEIFPLNQGVVRNLVKDNVTTVIEETLENAFDINGILTTGIYSSEGHTNYYTNDGNGLVMHGELNADGMFSAFEPPLVIINSNDLKLNDVVHSSGVYRIGSQGIGGVVLEYNSTSTIQQQELISTSFGTYAAIRINISLNIFGDILGVPFNSNINESIWLAETVGLVRRTQSNESGSTEYLLSDVSPNPFGNKLFSAVLPSARSIQLGDSATAFATVINTGMSDAIGCNVTLESNVLARLDYQELDISTFQLIGNLNESITIPSNSSKTFFISVTPFSILPIAELELRYDCLNADAAESISNVNTFTLSVDANPVSDVVAVTTVTDLVSSIGSTSLFAVGSFNQGISETLTVVPVSSNSNNALSLSICQTDPSLGTCISNIESTVTLDFLNQSNATFAIFVEPLSDINNNPADNRVLIKFEDSLGNLRGLTSTSIRTQ